METKSYDERRFVFDILCRDHFCCQRCHLTTPTVALTVVPAGDSIPEGKEKDAGYYVTHCYTCENELNGVPIPKSLELFNIRSEQMDHYMHWELEKKTNIADATEKVLEYVSSQIKPFPVGRTVQKEIRRYLRHNMDYNVIKSALDDACDDIIKFNTDTDALIADSVTKFNKDAPAYLRVANSPEPERSIYIVKGRLVRQFKMSPTEARSDLYDIRLALEDNGYTADEIAKILREKIFYLIGASKTKYEWESRREDFIETIECKK